MGAIQLQLVPPQPGATADDLTAVIRQAQLERGWTDGNIDEWNFALSMARQAMLLEGGFDSLDESEIVIVTCQRAVDFVFSKALLARILESFIEIGWATKEEVAEMLAEQN